MTTFLISLALILLAMLGLGIGVLCGRPPLGRGCARVVDPCAGCGGCAEGGAGDGDRA